MIGMVTFRYEEPSGSITLESFTQVTFAHQLVVRSNDAKGPLIFCAMKILNKFLFFFSLFESISTNVRI